MDVVQGNPKLIAALLLAIMSHYHFGGRTLNEETKELLDWVQKKIPDYAIKGFSGKQWNDGKALQALVHALAQDPEIIGAYGDSSLCAEHASLSVATEEERIDNLAFAMTQAYEVMGIPILNEPQELADPKLDEKTLVVRMPSSRTLPFVRPTGAPRCGVTLYHTGLPRILSEG